MFVDFLLPELLKEDGGTREEAKTRFDNWIQHGKRWAKLVEAPRFLKIILISILRPGWENSANGRFLVNEALVPCLKFSRSSWNKILPLRGQLF